MTIYGHIAKPSDRTILYLDNLQTTRVELHAFEGPEAANDFLDSHPEVQAVMFARSDMPHRAVPVEKARALMPKMWRMKSVPAADPAEA